MIIPIDKNAIFPYSLKTDVDEPKTIFKLGYLNSQQKAALSIQANKLTKENNEPSLWMFSIIRLGLKGWTNFKLQDGTDYEFKTDELVLPGFGTFTVMSDDCFAAFTLEQIAELSGKLLEINYLSKDEKKS
jgi:hypothetical protein